MVDPRGKLSADDYFDADGDYRVRRFKDDGPPRTGASFPSRVRLGSSLKRQGLLPTNSTFLDHELVVPGIDNIQARNEGNDLIPAQRIARPVRRHDFEVPLHSHLANEEPAWVQRRNDFRKKTSVEVIEKHDQVVTGAPKVVLRRIRDEQIESKIEPTGLITQLSNGDFGDIDETHLPLSGRQPEGMPTQPSRQVQTCSCTVGTSETQTAHTSRGKRDRVSLVRASPLHTYDPTSLRCPLPSCSTPMLMTPGIHRFALTTPASSMAAVP